MTDLTEQLEKGELPEGWYYLKVNEELANYPVIAECVLMSQFSYFYDFDEAKIEQVLAKVPSYEEWQETLQALDAAHKAIKMEDETINRLVRSGKQCNCENTKLKEQLETAVNALKPYLCHKLVFKCTDGTELEFEGSFKGSENINLEELNP